MTHVPRTHVLLICQVYWEEHSKVFLQQNKFYVFISLGNCGFWFIYFLVFFPEFPKKAEDTKN